VIDRTVSKKVVLITGCSSGFGYYSALHFARSGYYTFASVKSLKGEGVKKLHQIKHDEQLPLEILELDVSSDKSVKTGFEYIAKNSKKIDIVINNAGFGAIGPVEEFSIAEVKEQYETNIFGTLRVIKAVLPGMRAQKSGVIINISSVMGLMTMPLKGVYASSKFAIEALSETLRFELQSFGIKVVIVEPGPFYTNSDKNILYPQSIHAKDSPYRFLIERHLQNMKRQDIGVRNKKISALVNPERVAALLYQISMEQDPKLRYRIGIDHNLHLWKAVIPHSTWNLLLRERYKW